MIAKHIAIGVIALTTAVAPAPAHTDQQQEVGDASKR